MNSFHLSLIFAEPVLIATYVSILAYHKLRTLGKSFTFSVLDMLAFAILAGVWLQMYMEDYRWNQSVVIECSQRELLPYYPIAFGLVFGAFMGRCLAIRIGARWLSPVILLLGAGAGVIAVGVVLVSGFSLFWWVMK